MHRAKLVISCLFATFFVFFLSKHLLLLFVLYGVTVAFVLVCSVSSAGGEAYFPSSLISTAFTFLNRSEANTRSLSLSLVEPITSSLVPCHSL